MDVPFFVAFSAILLFARYLPFALPPAARAVLADAAAGPASTAKCAVSVAVAGLALLVSTTQCSAASVHHQDPECSSDVAMEMRALWFNCAALFLGVILGGGAVALHHRPPTRVPPIVQVAVDHLAGVTETVAITALAHDACVLVKVFNVKQ